MVAFRHRACPFPHTTTRTQTRTCIPTRIRAGIVADRCLAKAPTFAASPGTTDSLLLRAGIKSSPVVKAVAPTLGNTVPLDRSTGGGDFEAARAVAREAEANYGKAGNTEGALRARRTELSLKGDEAMAAVGPLLDRRYRYTSDMMLRDGGGGERIGNREGAGVGGRSG